MPALQYEYLWADGMKIKKPTRMSAPEYINSLFDWIESQVGTAAAAHGGSCRSFMSIMLTFALYMCRWLVACSQQHHSMAAQSSST